MGAASTRSSLRPLSEEGRRYCKTRTRSASRERTCVVVIAGSVSSEAIQAARLESTLDCFGAFAPRNDDQLRKRLFDTLNLNWRMTAFSSYHSGWRLMEPRNDDAESTCGRPTSREACIPAPSGSASAEPLVKPLLAHKIGTARPRISPIKRPFCRLIVATRCYRGSRLGVPRVEGRVVHAVVRRGIASLWKGTARHPIVIRSC